MMALCYATAVVYVITFCICKSHGEVLDANITFFPSEIRNLVEETTQNITLQPWWDDQKFTAVKLTVSSNDDSLLTVVGNSTIIIPSSRIGTNDTFITVRGVSLSKNSISFTVEPLPPDEDVQPLVIEYLVGVIRAPSVLDQVFIILVAVLVGAGTIAFGCNLKLDVIKKLFKRPIPLIIGFLCQYTIMPATAYGLGKLFSLPPELAFGLFVMGSCPGGGASNLWSSLLDGDIDLSIILTLISVVLSMGMLPLWIYTLGATIMGAQFTMPFENILIALLTLIIPCAIGILLRRYAPKVGTFIGKMIRPISLVLVITVVTFNFVVNWYIYQMLDDWRITVSCLLLPYIGMTLSGIVAFICRRPWTRIKTIMFETAIQNSGIAMIITRTALQQPEADLATVMPITAATFAPFPLIIWLVGSVIYKRCFKKESYDTDDEKGGDTKGNAGYQRQTSHSSQLQLTVHDHEQGDDVDTERELKDVNVSI